MTATTLSTIGRRDLAKHEATIGAHLKTFWDVGDALTAIRDGKLYRETHDTFDSSARRARQLMAGSESGTTVPISNERQARALAPLKDDPEAQQEAVKAASQDGPPTAKKIAAEVAKRVPAKDAHKTEGAGVEGSTAEGDAGSQSSDGADSHDAGRSESEPAPSPPSVIDATSRELDAARALGRTVGYTGPQVPDWNDEPLRTADEVFDALKNTAKALREEAGQQ